MSSVGVLLDYRHVFARGISTLPTAEKGARHVTVTRRRYAFKPVTNGLNLSDDE